MKMTENGCEIEISKNQFTPSQTSGDKYDQLPYFEILDIFRLSYIYIYIGFYRLRSSKNLHPKWLILQIHFLGVHVGLFENRLPQNPLVNHPLHMYNGNKWWYTP